MVLSHQGNVESGRMTKLGGDFCVMMLVQVPEGKLSLLSESLKKIEGSKEREKGEGKEERGERERRD